MVDDLSEEYDTSYRKHIASTFFYLAEEEKIKKEITSILNSEHPYIMDVGTLLNDKAVIKDTRKIYTSINRTKHLNWPNMLIKQLAGKDQWGAWRPCIGEACTIVYELWYELDKINVYIVSVGDYLVPVSSDGIELV